MDQSLITRIVEAALLAATQPLTASQLGALFTLDEALPDGAIEAALDTLRADCETRGVELVELASGWRYQVKPDVHGWVARLWTERQTKYTRATLETLALIAYRQPITRGEIEQVRGVATNSNIIKALEEREWIRVVGHRDMPGRPELLGTTKGFLDYFGLKRLDELPPLSELKDFAELDPQMRFASDDGPRQVGGITANADDHGDAAQDLTDDAADAPDADAHDDTDAPHHGAVDDAARDATGTGETAGTAASTVEDTDHDRTNDTGDVDPDIAPPDHHDTDADTGDQDPEPQDALAVDGDSDRSTS